MSTTTALAVFVASCGSYSSVSAFAPSLTASSVDIPTSRNFRQTDDADFSFPSSFSSSLDDYTDECETIGYNHDSNQSSDSSQQEIDDRSCSISTHFSISSANMPTWLRPSGDDAERKIAKLRETMLNSYLSQTETERVISAIRDASSGDSNQMAGAADFCQVLVDTIEMGVTTLIAAVFHYCDCYVASSSFSTPEYWSQLVLQDRTDRRIKFGDDVDRIAKDAARLKRTEMHAGQSLRSKPSYNDSANMRKMLLSETKEWRALAIRSAGCLFRLRGIDDHRSSSGINVVSPTDIRVAHEALQIHAPLASRLGMHRLKNEIESAAFRVLYPRQYAKVIALTQQQTPCDREGGCVISTLEEGMSTILQRVKDEIKDLLKNDPCFTKYAESVKVTARIKEPYSLWRKMLKMKARHVLEVPDSLALRVVLQCKNMQDEAPEVTSSRERALCYYAQQQCTKIFTPLQDGRFKDYIANPKANGYQSLHYTASTEFDGTQWPFEIQIRTGEMHQVAEFGLAAHWDYKEQAKIPSTSPHYAFNLDQSSDAYALSVQNWHWQQVHASKSWTHDGADEERSERVRARDEKLAPYLKSLMDHQSNLTREQIFIFLESQEEGVTLALPAGSCILDAIRESERAFGVTSSRSIEKGVEHNGSIASITRQLSNGDVLSIPF